MGEFHPFWGGQRKIGLSNQPDCQHCIWSAFRSVIHYIWMTEQLLDLMSSSVNSLVICVCVSVCVQWDVFQVLCFSAETSTSTASSYGKMQALPITTGVSQVMTVLSAKPVLATMRFQTHLQKHSNDIISWFVVVLFDPNRKGCISFHCLSPTKFIDTELYGPTLQVWPSQWQLQEWNLLGCCCKWMQFLNQKLFWKDFLKTFFYYLYGNSQIPDEHLRGYAVFPHPDSPISTEIRREGVGLDNTDFLLYLQIQNSQKCSAEVGSCSDFLFIF